MYILNILSATEKMTIKELKDFISENYYRRIRFTEENSYYSMKHRKKKDLLLVVTKFIEKEYLMLVMLKNNINYFSKTKAKNW